MKTKEQLAKEHVFSNPYPETNVESFIAGWDAGWDARQEEIDRLKKNIDMMGMIEYHP